MTVCETRCTCHNCDPGIRTNPLKPNIRNSFVFPQICCSTNWTKLKKEEECHISHVALKLTGSDTQICKSCVTCTNGSRKVCVFKHDFTCIIVLKHIVFVT